jgi:hypothetical protein
MSTQSICLFHNGNSRVIEFYQKQFANLKFCGNWAEAVDCPTSGCLWEICFADATFDNLALARSLGIKIIRHISTYQDDMQHLLPECEQFDYTQWINHAVTDNLCIADQVISDLVIDQPRQNTTIIITTGRTANTHLQHVYKGQNKYAFESSKKLDSAFFEAGDAILLWRLNQWACLTSTWIVQQTDYAKSHQLNHSPTVTFEHQVAPIDLTWVTNNWFNMCRITLDQAMLSKYVCRRPTSYSTTEFVTSTFETVQKPLSYRKQDIIPNYDEIQQWYDQSKIAFNLTTVYNNVIQHLIPWSIKI